MSSFTQMSAIQSPPYAVLDELPSRLYHPGYLILTSFAEFYNKSAICIGLFLLKA